MRRIIIVGGGASGLAAALAAAQDPAAQITVLERLDRVGKKILSTGNGRCNLGNADISPAHYHSAEPETLAAMLADMPASRTTDFFEGLGLLCRTEEDSGRIYPGTNQAATVLDVLLLALKRAGVQVCCGVLVTEICFKSGQFVLAAEGRQFRADRVILAAGGKAAPKLGTDGAGYPLAAAFGHHCLPVYPCLTALRCRGGELAGLKGIRVQGIAALYAGKTLLGQSRGEIQLADYGVSGIPAMELSCLLNRAQGPARVGIDLFPEWQHGQLRACLTARARQYPDEELETLFAGLLHKKIGYALLKRCGIMTLSRHGGSLRREELDALTRLAKDWSFPVEAALPWDRAQCTGGGVPLGEVDPRTMESRLQSGLYLTGELLDAVGNCGGFNLHWAFCTGLAAGRSALRT